MLYSCHQPSAAIVSAARLWFACVLLIFGATLGNIKVIGGEADDAGEAVQVLPVPMILLDNELFVGDLSDSELAQVEQVVVPPPHAPAKPGAFILRWDRYRTLIVIDDSAGLVKSCWVVTLTTMPEQIQTPRGPVMIARGQVVVAYRAQAYYDKTGTLQIDSRRAKLSGSMWDNWSPDSFSIGPDKKVFSRDDDPTHPSNAGEIEKEVPADQQAAEYRKLSFAAQAIICGNI